MVKNCEKCKFFDEDYIFDDEIGEEYPIYDCKKNHNDFLNDDKKECPYFE